MKPVSRKFFQQSTLDLAKTLIGKILVNETEAGIIAGRIIETEAYLKDDPASHSFNGLTKRNSPMFNHSGTAYIYFTYGMYNCFNVVSNKKGVGEAVLIRALQPLKGINLMKKNRNKDKLNDLCSGPAKLVIALGITKNMNNESTDPGKKA